MIVHHTIESLTLSDLRRLRDEAARENKELNAEMRALESRTAANQQTIDRVDSIIAEVRALYPDGTPSNDHALPVLRGAERDPGDEGFDVQFNGGKVRSVEMVRILIEESASGLTRDQIHEHFFARWGQQSWGNPRNALTTAIGRALQRGLIRERKSGVLVAR